jgi:hypothetical protein
LYFPDAIGNLNIDLPVNRRFQFVVVKIFQPHLGVLLGVEVVVHPHPFVKVPGEDHIERGWQQIMFPFEPRQRRADWNRGGSFIVAHQIEMRH